MSKSKIAVTVGIKNAKAGAGIPHGAYTAQLMIDGVYKTGKSQAITLEDEGVIAYDTVSLWATDKALEMGVTSFTMPSKDELDRRLAGNKKSLNSVNKAVTVNPNESKHTSMFKGKGYARAALKRAIEELGIDRVKAVMLDMVEHLDQFEIEFNEKAQKQEDANKTIAQSLFDVCKNTGIDMSASINNAEVLMIYNQLVTQDKQDGDNV